MDLGLTGTRALVAGGSLGIGRAAAARLAIEGARVAIVARTPETLHAAAREIGAHAIQADLGRPDEVERAVAEARRVLGGLDVLVNSLGAARSGDFATLAEDDWAASLESKLLAQVRVMRAVVPLMRAARFGRIVCVVGSKGLEPDPKALPAGAANAALLNVVKGLGRDLAPHGVLVSAVSPPPMQTRRLEYLVDAQARIDGTSRETARAKLLSDLPLGRFATPEEVAPLIAFLASPLNTYVTATNVAIDGGATRGL